MHVTLSIKDDSELRAMIKDMIVGQVKSITREDIGKILHEATDKGSASRVATIETRVHQELSGAVKKAVTDTLGGYNMRETIRNMVKDVVVDEVRRALGK